MHTTMKILIAYDGSNCVDAELDDLRRAGLLSEADVALSRLYTQDSRCEEG